MKKFLSDLFKEISDPGTTMAKSKISLGRLLLVLTFLIMSTTWIVSIIRGSGMDPPPALLEAFLVLASYVLGTKVVSGLRFKWENGNLQSMGNHKEE
jgi:hypothetical protein